MTSLEHLRRTIREHTLAREDDVLQGLSEQASITQAVRQAGHRRAVALIESIRSVGSPGLMEVFLAEYGLSTDEGVALMCLAEALLRVPDTLTIDALIEDKIAPSAWGEHLGQSASPLVNASTWALMLTGKVLSDGPSAAPVLRAAIKRLGEPVIRLAVKRAMKELGGHFVLGETIADALARGRTRQAQGYTFSYDMLGEAALTQEDADTFFEAYRGAIAALAKACAASDIRSNPGISIKLSALHPRYETGKRTRVLRELTARTTQLAQLARAAGMGFNIDAEEANRLDISLDVIEAVLRDPALAGWDGFGVVVQAYGKRALPVIEWVHALAVALDRRVMVRLVKGAYWDSEIKRAQIDGLAGFPVFTRKAATDVSYLCCARRLLDLTDRIYPQFATHNAHTVAMILEMADDPGRFEFQRLHGMGEALHDQVLTSGQARCRIYAPVGPHRDLLAYLVRRLLENGANSSFVNQIVDTSLPAHQVAADPFDGIGSRPPAIVRPAELFAPERVNARGTNLQDPVDIAAFEDLRAPYADKTWTVGPILAAQATGGAVQEVRNPARPDDLVGTLTHASQADVEAALAAARPWSADPQERAAVLVRASDLMEAAAGELFALLTREAGKTPLDCIAELREAVDFLRYYAARGREGDAPPRGLFACISPWNFPLAIFTGQIAAALAAGNGVLAKPAEPTGLVAGRAVRLLHEAGVPARALQLLPGEGSGVGAQITAAQGINGICFTGSTATARTIHRVMARSMEPTAPLIAETGGINAMIVDSTALPEQATRDVLASAFQSAGQRCSALRMLYVQEDVAPAFLDMLFGAMDELTVGDPWSLATDIGPIITDQARDGIAAYIDRARAQGRLLKQIDAPKAGCFIGPAVIRVEGILDLEQEIFGPVLHVATFRAAQLDQVVTHINATGYGLTFGIHSRIDDRVDLLASTVRAGNIYVNRNQIGAIVGSQPFGGEGLSGTGPKAGGPHYVSRFTRPARKESKEVGGAMASMEAVQRWLDQAEPDPAPLAITTLPGPTGESNRLSQLGRGIVLCLGPNGVEARLQAKVTRANGCTPVCVAHGLAPDEGVDGALPPSALASLAGFNAVITFAGEDSQRAMRQALASRSGPIIPLLAEEDFGLRCRLERHVCIDTTAAGGNASLLAQAG